MKYVYKLNDDGNFASVCLSESNSDEFVQIVDGIAKVNARAIVQGDSGRWYFADDTTIAEQEYALKAEAESYEEEQKIMKQAEAQRVPDLEDAVCELGEVVEDNATTSDDALVELASIIEDLQSQIDALKASKE